MRRALFAAVLLVSSTCSAALAHELADAPANQPFERTWARTDEPVAEGEASRTWMWGPEAFTGAMTEPYVEAPGGERAVQYFDKSRMEDSAYRADGPPWDVTNGLLVVELMTGRMQVGDDSFEDREPAGVNIAGDADDVNGMRYRNFAAAMSEPPHSEGATIIALASSSGGSPSGFDYQDDPSLAEYEVTAEFHVSVTDHRVASVFWEFLNSGGTIYEDGQYLVDNLFPDPFYATGYPITEAYWTVARVGGTEKLVLLQCFERRCLTYTPDNPEGWQVEAGNVGRHYYQWRYGGDPGTPDDPPPPSGETPVELECEALGYPCSLADSSPEAVDLIFDYGESMVEMMEAGSSMDELLGWVSGQPGVVEARGNDVMIRFRVDGASPGWVYDSRAFNQASGQVTSTAVESSARTGSALPDPASTLPHEVVGKDRNGDGLTDEQPKRALVLSPFLWSFEPSDAGPEIAAMLEGTRGYGAGNVHHYANPNAGDQNVRVSHFMDWDTYDVIYVASHGGEVCWADQLFGCDSVISTGVRVTREFAKTVEAVGGSAMFPGYDFEGAKYIGLGNDFFRNEYGVGAIENTIIYLDACSTYESTDVWSTAGTLPRLLSGWSNLVFGWEGSVYNDHAADSAILLFDTAIEEGTPMGSSFTGTYSEIINDGTDDATLRLTTGESQDGGSADLRIRETVTQLNPMTGQPLASSHAIPILGEYGDGLVDDYPFMIDVEGVNADPSEFIVHFRVNGQDLDETFTLAEGELIGGGLGSGAPVYRLHDQVSLDRDVSRGERIEVMVWVELPEGGATKNTISPSLDNPVLTFYSYIEYNSEAAYAYSRVQAEIMLDYSGGGNFTGGIATLDHQEFDYELPSASPCRVTRSTPIDGELYVGDVVFTTSSDGSVSYVPEWAELQPREVMEEFIVYCPDIGTDTVQTQAIFVEMWEGFHSGAFGHENERIGAQGAFRIADWASNGEKVYDRTADSAGYTVKEYTEIRVNPPASS